MGIERFSIECRKSYRVYFGLNYCALWLLSKTCAIFWANENENQTVTCLHAFSRAWRQMPGIASNSDWLIVLVMSVVIGQSNYVWFCKTQLKTALLGGFTVIFARFLGEQRKLNVTTSSTDHVVRERKRFSL